MGYSVQQFVTYIDNLRWAFEGREEDKLNSLLKEIRRTYEQQSMPVCQYIALMNTGNAYMTIIKEERAWQTKKFQE